MKQKASWDKYNIQSFSFFPADYITDKQHRQKKHLVWIINRYVPLYNAGSECMAHVINKYLSHKGWNVSVLVPETSGSFFEGVRTIPFDHKKEAQKVLEEASILVSQHTYEPIAERAAKLLDLPILYVIHENTRIPHLHKRLQAYEKRKIHLLYNSTWLERFYKTRGWNLDSRVLFPPVFPHEYNFKRNPGGKYVGLINCNENKGGSFLIDLASKMPDTDFVGRLGSYGYQITQNGLPNLRYLPHSANKYEIYKDIDIILMPSKRESWGRVAVEAMSLGIPVIAHPTRGLQESLGSAGLFANRNEPQEWVRLIRRLKEDPWFYMRKSMEGQARANELDPTKQLAEIEGWLQKIQDTS
jgi:glycosyltransferase involved in cell wall biosynthesis